jgi:hypothetical protein
MTCEASAKDVVVVDLPPGAQLRRPTRPHPASPQWQQLALPRHPTSSSPPSLFAAATPALQAPPLRTSHGRAGPVSRCYGCTPLPPVLAGRARRRDVFGAFRPRAARLRPSTHSAGPSLNPPNPHALSRLKTCPLHRAGTTSCAPSSSTTPPSSPSIRLLLLLLLLPPPPPPAANGRGGWEGAGAAWWARRATASATASPSGAHPPFNTDSLPSSARPRPVSRVLCACGCCCWIRACGARKALR